MYLTAQENAVRFNQEPPEGFMPFEGNSGVSYSYRHDMILTRGAPSGPEYFNEYHNPVEWMGKAYQFKISPKLSKTVSALVFTSSEYRIHKLATLSNVEEYLESQLKSWYNRVLPNLKKKDRNGRLVLVEGTYVTEGAVGLLHYSRDKARKVKPDDVIKGIFGRKLSTMTTTSDIGGQAYKYVWNIMGPGSSQANLKRTMIEPAQFNGNHICFGIVALSLWEK
ncbi:hypothetical protein JR316_0004418 [Psilocybe cubensis]|uniref:Uncharacterized protein n=2 Tax=Psilocybe cubensis TaxID=181762 RepID=A0ACB8H2U5_PSICU|nr:hypothetical protein JR316_0004418 [Psilocybe cubensis]KAH9482320.1 hypothetical protein JR316_0004418 [Psilocybe cubensis]